MCNINKYIYNRRDDKTMGDKDAVSEGAILECTLGVETSELKVPDFHGVGTQGKNAANITDHIPNHNIFSFELCKRQLPPVPCEPLVIMRWLRGHPDYTVEHEMALLKRCIVPCSFGGVISIKESGQDE